MVCFRSLNSLINYFARKGTNKRAKWQIKIHKITNSVTKEGYGLVYIEARHGEQIRNAGFKTVVDFVEEVAKKKLYITAMLRKKIQICSKKNRKNLQRLTILRHKYGLYRLSVAIQSHCRNKRDQKSTKILEPIQKPCIFASGFWFIHALIGL